MKDDAGIASGRPMRIRIGRYTGVAQGLHWASVVLMSAILPLAWVMTSVAKDNPNRDALFMWHKSIGITIFLLVIARLTWRATHPAPMLPSSMVQWQVILARVSHWLLYAVLVVMPVSGYIMSAARGRVVPFFDLINLPALAENKDLFKLAQQVHLTTQWAVYVLVGLHILATVWHITMRRDGILERMLPAQRNADPS
jgi:cytochrome b561